MASLTWASSQIAWPLLKSGSIDWKGPLAESARQLRESLEAVRADEFQTTLGHELLRRQAAVLEGIQGYRAHPYHRSVPEVPTLWREGATQLLDYGVGSPRGKKSPDTIPLLVVPSLINRAYVLDLMADHSFLRWLAGEGFHPYLMDWGAPGAAESSFSLDDYITGRLSAALSAVRAQHRQAPLLLGYCMGGLLTLALAQQRPQDVAGLVLLATPWDFHAGQAAQAQLASNAMASLWPQVERAGVLSVDFIQSLFAMLDPLMAARKFEAFSRLDPSDPKAEAFVALEDWLNDGVALTAPVARECIDGWYAENTTVKGQWIVAGEAVDPRAVTLPSLCVIPAQDRIVPPASAEALAAALPKATRMTPRAGHIGMIVSRRAPKTVWQPLADWMRAASQPER